MNNEVLESFKWVLRVIHSCRDTFQIDTCRVMIDLFHARYKDDTMTDELKIAHQYQYDNIHSILK